MMYDCTKRRSKKIIDSLPEDASYEEILRELAFDTMIQRGLDDDENGKLISNKDMENIISQW